MLSTVGLCDETTAIVGAGHDVQVVNVDVTVEDYDTAIDYIVTPTRLIETRHEYPRPSKGIIWSRRAGVAGILIRKVMVEFALARNDRD